METVLIVDDDLGSRETFSLGLRGAGFQVATAADGREALDLARARRPVLAIIDVNLPDMSGLEVVRSLRVDQLDAPVLMVTGFATTRLAVEAMRLGVSDFLEKPVDVDALVSMAVQLVAAHRARQEAETCVTHAATRWAKIVTRAIDSPSDPKTVHEWARLVAASPGAIRNWCSTSEISAKRSLNFARMLRVVIQRERKGLRVEELLDVVDRRTFAKLLALGAAVAPELPRTADEFMNRQRWVTSETLLLEVRRLLRLPQAPSARAPVCQSTSMENSL